MSTKLHPLAELLRLRGLGGALDRELARAQKEGSPVEEVLGRLGEPPPST